MGKELAIKGCTFKASINPGTISANCSTSTTPSKDVLDIGSGNGVFFDKITVEIPSGASVTLPSPPPSATSPSGQLMAPATIDISGTADNVLRGNKKAVLKGDSGTKTITFTFPAPNGATTTFGVSVKVEVDDPGQTDVIAL